MNGHCWLVTSPDRCRSSGLGIQDLVDAPTDNGQLLHPMETISDIWSGQPPDKHLHVFVSLLGGVGGGVCFIRLFAPAQNI